MHLYMCAKGLTRNHDLNKIVAFIRAYPPKKNRKSTSGNVTRCILTLLRGIHYLQQKTVHCPEAKLVHCSEAKAVHWWKTKAVRCWDRKQLIVEKPNRNCALFSVYVNVC